MTGESSRETVRGKKLPLTSKQIPCVAFPHSTDNTALMHVHPSSWSSTGSFAECLLCAPGLGQVRKLSLVGEDQQKVHT